MTLPLTEKQERLWRYIRSCDRSPTYEEMAQAIGIKAKGAGVYEVVRALEAKGFVRRTPGRARSLVAIDVKRELAHISTAELAAEVARRLAS
jgi:repressor LexA